MLTNPKSKLAGNRMLVNAVIQTAVCSPVIGIGLAAWCGIDNGPLNLVCFFLCISAADICVKSMGVRMRQQPLLVQGDDLGAAVGPLLGYALLQAELPPSAVIATQATVHAIATLVALAAVRADPHSGGVRATSPVRSGTEVAIQRVALAAEHDDGGDEER